MNEQKSHISASQDFEIQQPGRGRAYLVPVLEWDHLKGKVLRIESGGLGFQTAGSVFWGIAGTAIVGALSIPKDFAVVGASSIHVCWGIAIIGVICGSMSLYFAGRQRKLGTYTKQDVILEMEQVEKRYGRTEQTKAASS